MTITIDDKATSDTSEIQCFVLAKNPADTHIKITTDVTRNRVTNAWYLKCNCRASKRSTAIAVMVNKDAITRMGPKISIGRKRVFSPLTKFAMDSGWRTKPTVRSDTARLANKIFDTECKEDVFQIVIRVAEFPNTAAKERITLITETVILKLISCSNVPWSWDRKLSTVWLWEGQVVKLISIAASRFSSYCYRLGRCCRLLILPVQEMQFSTFTEVYFTASIAAS